MIERILNGEKIYISSADIARFEEKFEKTDGCWIWTSSLAKKGYPQFWLNGKNIIGTRASYLIYKGNLESIKVLACHKCDNPKCVNPDHLWLGTASDNQSDMTEKGRGRVGNKNGNAKLTGGEVIKIRDLYATGKYTHREIAEIFGVSHMPIGAILRGEIWCHV